MTHPVVAGPAPGRTGRRGGWAVVGLAMALAGCRGDAPTAAAPVARVSTPSAASIAALQQLDPLLKAGRTDEAFALVSQWVEREPDVPQHRLALGLVVGERDGFEAAVPHYEAALALDPAHVPTLAALMRGYAALGDTDAAVAMARRVLAQQPADGEAATIAGRALVDGGDHAGALAVLAPAERSGRAEVFALIGRAQQRLGDDAAAEQAYRRALALDPRALEAMLNLGQMLQRTGRSDEGQRLLERHQALSAEADALSFAEESSQVAGAGAANFLTLGESRLRQGDLDGAEDAFERAAARDPGEARAPLGLAMVATARQAHETALAFAQQAVALDGQQSMAHLLLGAAEIRTGQVEAGRRSIERSQRLATWQARDWNILGQAYFDAGLFDDALAAYQAGYALSPEDDVMALRLGFLAHRQGQAAAAREVLEPAAARAPDNPDLALALAIVLDGSGDPRSAAMLDEAVARHARAGDLTPAQRAARFGVFVGAERVLAAFQRQAAAVPSSTATAAP